MSEGRPSRYYDSMIGVAVAIEKGATSVGYDSETPNQVRVNFETAEQARAFMDALWDYLPRRGPVPTKAA